MGMFAWRALLGVVLSSVAGCGDTRVDATEFHRGGQPQASVDAGPTPELDVSDYPPPPYGTAIARP